MRSGNTAHILHTKATLATFKKLAFGNWRVQVRRKGQYASASFRRKHDAQSWALETERRIDLGEDVTLIRPVSVMTFGHLVDIHIHDMLDVGTPLRHSKSYTLEMLKAKLGHLRIDKISRERLIKFGRERAKAGAGPVTIATDFSYIGTIVTHAAAVHGIQISREPVELTRIALRRLGLIGRGNERDRRPSQIEGASGLENVAKIYSFTSRKFD